MQYKHYVAIKLIKNNDIIDIKDVLLLKEIRDICSIFNSKVIYNNELFEIYSNQVSFGQILGLNEINNLFNIIKDKGYRAITMSFLTINQEDSNAPAYNGEFRIVENELDYQTSGFRKEINKINQNQDNVASTKVINRLSDKKIEQLSKDYINNA